MKSTFLHARSLAFSLTVSQKCWILLFLLLSANSSFSQNLDLAWATQASGTHSQAYGTTVDQNGNVYTIGYFSGTVDFDPGSGVFNLTSTGQDVFVQKLNATGNFVWAMKFGAGGNDIPNNVTVDSFGHVYVIGSFAYTVDFDPGPGVFNLTSPTYMTDAFILQLDTAGNFGWAKQWGSRKEDYAFGITTDNSGNIYVAGSFKDTVDFDPGPGVFNIIALGGAAGYLLKLDNSGNMIFAKRLGAVSASISTACNNYSISVDKNRNIFIGGYFKGTNDFDPGSGSFTLSSVPSGNFNAFVAKLDSSANFQWAKQIGGTVSQAFVYSVATDSSGNVFLFGSFDYTIDLDPGAGTFFVTSAAPIDLNAYTVKLDPAGNFVWGNQLASPVGSQNMTACVDRSGYVYISGMFSGSVDFDPGAGTFFLATSGTSTVYNTYIQKLNNNGNFVKAVMIDGNHHGETRSMAVDRKKNVYLVGGIQGTYDFDPGAGTVSLSSLSNMSMTVSKFSQRKFGTDTVEACGSYTINEHTYTVTGAYTDTIVSSDEPDSIVTFTLFVNPLPAAGTITGVDTVCKSSSTTLTASVIGGTWSVTDAVTASVSAGGVVSGLVVGLDTVIYTVTDAVTGCSSTVVHPIYVKNCQNNPNAVMGLNNTVDFGIIPNPNNGNFRISVTTSNNNGVLIITNIEGKEVYRSAITNKDHSLAPDLPTGIYLIRLTSGNTTQVQKMIIAR